MKLLMISGDRSILAGKKSAFWYTLQELTKHWDRIDIICPAYNGQSSDFPTVFFHPSPYGLWYQPWWIAQKGQELIAAHGYEVMTVHEFPPFYNGLGARKLHRLTGIPYMLEIHHIVGYPVAASFTERIGALMSRLLLAWDARPAAAVRVVNREVGQRLQQFGVPSEKIRLLPSFYLDPDALKPDLTIEKKYDLVFAGRLVANKGLPVVLQAMRQLQETTLLVIGDGPMRKAWEQEAAALGSRVTFVGWLPTQADVMTAIQSAKIFVLPSSSEGGPRVALEAMACGMPVVSTAVGVMPDVIEDGVNGVMIDGTAADLQQTIEVLLKDTVLRQKIGQEAQNILQKFERKKLIAAYVQGMKGLLRG